MIYYNLDNEHNKTSIDIETLSHSLQKILLITSCPQHIISSIKNIEMSLIQQQNENRNVYATRFVNRALVHTINKLLVMVLV